MGLLPVARSHCCSSLCIWGFNSPQPPQRGAGPGAAEAAFPGSSDGAGRRPLPNGKSMGPGIKGLAGARATVPGRPWLLAPRAGSLGKQGAPVLRAPAATAWPGSSLLRATRFIAPSATLYISRGEELGEWVGGRAQLRAASLHRARGVPAEEAPGSLHCLCKQEIHKRLQSPFWEQSCTGHSSPFTHCSANPKYHPCDGVAAPAILP